MFFNLFIYLFLGGGGAYIVSCTFVVARNHHCQCSSSLRCCFVAFVICQRSFPPWRHAPLDLGSVTCEILKYISINLRDSIHINLFLSDSVGMLERLQPSTVTTLKMRPKETIFRTADLAKMLPCSMTFALAGRNARRFKSVFGASHSSLKIFKCATMFECTFYRPQPQVFAAFE